jgi:hypothetical protein
VKREEGDHQPQKKTVLENVRSQVLFKELERKSQYTETLQKRPTSQREGKGTGEDFGAASRSRQDRG